MNWTSLSFGSIIFETTDTNWKQYTSLLQSTILGKEKLLFLIENEQNHQLFGGYLSSKITSVNTWIEDEHSFLFTVKDNRMQKFEIKPENKQYAFCLYPENKGYLFDFGHNDIVICAKNYRSSIYQTSFSTFNYHDIPYALIGKKGYNCFSPSRICIIQLQ